MFIVGSMTQLAHYVYQDYHLRVDALRAQAQQKQKVLKDTSNIHTSKTVSIVNSSFQTQNMVLPQLYLLHIIIEYYNTTIDGYVIKFF